MNISLENQIMKNGNLVSIIIPVYNGSNYLKEAIESALNQSYKNIEIIVVNDGSTDGGETERIAKEYGDRIKYFHKSNGGVSTALNYGVQKASGEIISWLSHDDLFSTDKTKNQMSVLKEQPEKTIVYGDSIFMNEKGELEKHKVFSNNRHNSFAGIENFFPLNVCFASSLFPRQFLLEHPFNEKARFTQDIEQFYLFLKNGYTFVHVKNAIYFSRNHNERVSVKRMDLFEHDTLAFHDVIMNDLKISFNTSFAKRYYLFSVEKKNKYPVYIKICSDLKELLKTKKKFGILIMIRAFFINIYAKIGFALRKKLSGR